MSTLSRYLEQMPVPGVVIDDPEDRPPSPGDRTPGAAPAKGGLRKHLNAYGGLADYLLAGMPSTAVGMMPWNRLGDTRKAASDAFEEDFRKLHPGAHGAIKGLTSPKAPMTPETKNAPTPNIVKRSFMAANPGKRWTRLRPLDGNMLNTR